VSRTRHADTHDQPTPPEPGQEPRERIFEFTRVRDDTRWRCELRDHGYYGVAAEFYVNGRFFELRMFAQWQDLARSPRASAIAWANEEREALLEDE
jgi:hypothetical protein